MKKRSEIKRNRIQVMLSDDDIEKFDEVLKSTNESSSNLMRNVFYSFYADWKKMSQEERSELWVK